MARFAGTELANYFSTPDFTSIGGTNMKGQSLQRNTATKAEGLVHGAGINSMAQVASAGFQADAIKAQGQAQGQAAMASGIGSMVSGIAGGFGARGSGGSTGGSGFSGAPMKAADAVPRNAYSTYTPAYNFHA